MDYVDTIKRGFAHTWNNKFMWVLGFLAALGFGLQQADNELPNLGYALVFPVATITKVIVAQLLLILLSG